MRQGVLRFVLPGSDGRARYGQLDDSEMLSFDPISPTKFSERLLGRLGIVAGDDLGVLIGMFDHRLWIVRLHHELVFHLFPFR